MSLQAILHLALQQNARYDDDMHRASRSIPLPVYICACSVFDRPYGATGPCLMVDARQRQWQRGIL